METSYMQSRPKALKVLDIVSIVLFIAAALMAFVYAPTEAVMGQVQRVFYFHVATAWVGMLGFMAAGVAGVGYLRTNKRTWDTASMAAVEISLVFFLITIMMGSIWARPIWNTWWNWDVRLTTAAIVELIYAAYLMLRQGIEDPDRRARFGAVYTILAFFSVPITFIAIRLYQSIHPVVIGGGEGSGLAPKMLQTMIFCVITFSFIFISLIWHRIRLGQMADEVEQKQLKLAN